MNTPNIRYYARLEDCTSNGRTPKYVITAQAGYYPPMNELVGKDGKISMYLQVSKDSGSKKDNAPAMKLQAKNSLNFTGLKDYFVNGRLSGFAYGYPLDMNSTAQAIEKLSDNLHLAMAGARVTGVEFGRAFVMKHPIENYLSKLGDMPKLLRYHFDVGTLYYKPRGRQQSKVYAFYDKKADAAAKGMVLPVGFEDANLLKYEMRLNGRLPKQLGVAEVTASTLSESGFYRQMVKRYQDSYFAISKLNQVKTDIMSEIKTVSDAFDVLVARLINQSDQTQIAAFLGELKEAWVFEDRKSYTRLKKKIQEVAAKAGVTVSDELLKELDDEIKNAGAYV